MLDLTILKRALTAQHEALIKSHTDEHKLAAQQFAALSANDFEQVAQKDSSLPRLIASVNIPQENLEHYSVCGVDGSQIYPDRHEGSAVGVIHTAVVKLAYGKNSKVEIATAIELVVPQEEQLEASDIDALRLLYELKHVYSCVIENKPDLVLFDGSLLYWNVEKLSEKLSEEYLGAYLDIVYKLYQQQVPVAGFVSLPNNRELVKVIETAAEQPFANTRDRHLPIVSPQLHVFISNHDLAKLYPPALRPCFVYFETGAEIARLEVPYWIVEQASLLERVVAIVYNQVRKGAGYPVVLAESHQAAVITAREREQFYLLLQQIALPSQQSIVSSRKLQRKRCMYV